MTEDAVDLSRGKTLDGDSIENPKSDKKPLSNDTVNGEPLENYDERLAGDVLEAMHDVSALSAGNAKGDGKDVSVSGLQYQHFTSGDTDMNYFTIKFGERGFAVYCIDNEVFYRPLNEFEYIFKETLGNDEDYSAAMFKHDLKNPEESLHGINVRRREDCLFVIDSIFGSLTGRSYNSLPVSMNDSLTENIKIRRHNKLGTDGLINKSLKAHDAKYGDKEEHDFKQELEDA